MGSKSTIIGGSSTQILDSLVVEGLATLAGSVQFGSSTPSEGQTLTFSGGQWGPAGNGGGGSVDANTAKQLLTARDIAISGDGIGNTSFDGTANVVISMTLSNTSVAPGTYGNSSVYSVVTVDSKGRLTSANTIALPAGTTVLDSVANTSTTIAAAANSVKRAFDLATTANSGLATSYSNAVAIAATDASSKAATAYSNAVSIAATDASTKSGTAYSNAVAQATTLSGTAYSNAVTQATALASTAYSNAVAVSVSGDNTTYANAILFASNSSNQNSGTVAIARLPVGNATSSGILTVLDSVTNTSITIAASANSVKRAFDAATAAGSATTAYTNAIAVASNASNLTSGLVSPALLPQANATSNGSVLILNSVSNSAVAIYAAAPASVKTAFDLATTANSGLATAYSNAIAVAANASNLTTGLVPVARMPGLTGDLSSSNGSSTLVLNTVNPNVGTFGNSTSIPSVTVNGKGLVTAVSNVTIAPDWASISNKPTTLSGFGITDAANTSDLSEIYVNIAMLEMLAADALNQGQYIGVGGNRFADSYDTTTYLNTGTSTNMSTAEAGVIKPTANSGYSETTGAVQGNDNVSDRLSITREFAIDNSTTVNSIGLSSANRNYTLKIVKRNSATSYDVVYSQAVSYTGGGSFQDFTLSSPFVVPSTGTYYVGHYYVGGAGQDIQVRNVAGTEFTSSGDIGVSTGNGAAEGTRGPVMRVTYAGQTNNMDGRSATLTAAAVPTTMKALFMVEETVAITLNTDFVASVSRDAGTSWSALTLTKRYTINSISLYEGAELSVTSQGSGSSPAYKIVSNNNKAFKVHAVALYWK